MLVAKSSTSTTQTFSYYDSTAKSTVTQSYTTSSTPPVASVGTPATVMIQAKSGTDTDAILNNRFDYIQLPRYLCESRRLDASFTGSAALR